MKKSIDISLATAVIILLLIVSFSLTPCSLYANGVLLPSYGQGKIAVRVYTDYFCGPCRAGEPRIEALLSELVKANKIKLMFVDTPAHRETVLYAQYFFYILNNKKDFDHILTARRALFDSASNKIVTKERLEEFLAQKGIGFRTFDAKSTLTAMNQFIKDDKIRATPTVVIDNGKQKEQFSGADAIVKALELLK